MTLRNQDIYNILTQLLIPINEKQLPYIHVYEAFLNGFKQAIMYNVLVDQYKCTLWIFYSYLNQYDTDVC